MATYVDITRSEIEEWLDTMPRFRGRWKLSDGTSGIYLLPLSANVGIKFSSTVGSRNTGMKRGRASAQLRLVSLVTGRVLNKKAQGQRGFFRTTNWRDNWKKGIDTFVAVYTKSTAFYERIALPEDQQIDPQQSSDSLSGTELEAYLERLRCLWAAVNEAGDKRSADFVRSVGEQVKRNKRRVSEKQRNWLENLDRRHGNRADEICRARSQRRVASLWIRRKAL